MLEAVMRAAEKAGQLIEQVRAEGFSVEEKGGQGPVTEADRRADASLKEDLLALESCGWLSEESHDDGSRFEHKRLWVVDPLDGTKEFVKGLPEYSVAIALVEDGVAQLGVVHNPATGETFAAERGAGARGNDGVIRVDDGRSVLASRSEMRAGEFAPFEGGWEIKPIGSIEYKLGLIGGGLAACTFSRGPKWEWDVCAGALIVEEAGGRATDVFGNPLRYNQRFPKVRGILAGAPVAYEMARREIQKLGPSERMAEFDGIEAG